MRPLSKSSEPTVTLKDRVSTAWVRLKAFLFPGKAEDDPQFAEEIQRRSVRGLYIIAGVTGFMPVMGVTFHAIMDIFEPQPMPTGLVPATLVFLALMALVAARATWGRRHARLLGLAFGIAVATVLIWANFTGVQISPDPALAAMIDAIVVIVVGLTAVPTRPMQMFVFAWGISIINFVSAMLASSYGWIPAPSLHYYAGFDLLVLLCVVLAGLNYQLVHEGHLAHQEKLGSQSRLLQAETAISYARLSATLSHELNSPLGALKSSVDSLQSLRTRSATDTRLTPEKVDVIRGSLLDGASQATAKIDDVVGRIQRFTNLDRAEVTSVEIDRMLQDVAQMVAPAGEVGPAIRLNVAHLPKVELKPQAISGVFSRLMHNAVKASADRGPVDVSATSEVGYILVSVEDQGDGLTDQQLAELFQPGFKTRGGLIQASKWGLFTARQVVREHGGDISAARSSKGGTRVTVRLPLDSTLASA